MELFSVTREANGFSEGDAARGLPIDHRHLRRFTFGSEALEHEVLGLFAGQAPESLEALKRALDAKSWRDAAHTLKGSARAVGAWRVADRAAEAEGLRDGHSHPDRSGAIVAVEEALDEACAYIAQL